MNKFVYLCLIGAVSAACSDEECGGWDEDDKDDEGWFSWDKDDEGEYDWSDYEGAEDKEENDATDYGNSVLQNLYALNGDPDSLVFFGYSCGSWTAHQLGVIYSATVKG